MRSMEWEWLIPVTPAAITTITKAAHGAWWLKGALPVGYMVAKRGAAVRQLARNLLRRIDPAAAALVFAGLLPRAAPAAAPAAKKAADEKAAAEKAASEKSVACLEIKMEKVNAIGINLMDGSAGGGVEIADVSPTNPLAPYVSKGDVLVSINGQACEQGHERASDMLRAATGIIDLVFRPRQVRSY